MSSERFSDQFDPIDDALWDEVDAIVEKAYATPSASPIHTSTAQSGAARNEAIVIDNDDDIYDQYNSLMFDQSAWEQLEQLEGASRNPPSDSALFQGSSARKITSQSSAKQTTLFGATLSVPESSKRSVAVSAQTAQKGPRSQSHPKAIKTKVWDVSSFAKTGWKK